ncbi:MAG TPA: hypothetical protein VK591_10250 [Xanthobacteraceae bacterium]|nr:hypothetical protein [Xanthobacteraceae bacterium]
MQIIARADDAAISAVTRVFDALWPANGPASNGATLTESAKIQCKKSKEKSGWRRQPDDVNRIG